MQRPDESQRAWQFETFEERLAFSVEPVADFWLDNAADEIIERSSAFFMPLAAEGHGWTDVAQAREQYGLRGGRQTVAIIDSGIAYDHVALGGGLGKAYRVVGGWDFAENDANPYDDGPGGFHGTHLAGIVGSSDSRYPGLAPGADLVALRVLDDQGNGNFAWVEQALAWVHAHRGDFEHPITTVNLSLGTEWNASSLPKWASLEDELKQLASDGTFISVAAGNSFQAYNAPGLSYPAVSHHVTPVASVDASGALSRFSQRSERVLAAPGERIMSTLPDHFYGGDGIKNDWGAASGTSMAAPYVAGASVLVREAMENLGFTNITQATIYDLFRRTADVVYDTATSASYRRVDLQAALQTLVGVDEHGSSAADATQMGRLATTMQVAGTISSTNDQDFFRFTAGSTGKATLTLIGPQHLGAIWKDLGGGRIEGGKLVIEAVAGQSYVVSIGGGVTIGKYAVDMRLEAAPSGGGFSAADWGTIDQARIDNVAISGDEKWFQITAARSGRVTVEAFFANARGNIDLELYDGGQRLLATSSGRGNSERIDVNAAVGDRLYIRVRGNHADVDFRITNLLTVSGNQIAIFGTEGGDAVRWQAGAPQRIEVNGVSYLLPSTSQLVFDGRGGHDTMILIGGIGAESVNLLPGSAELFAAGCQLTASNMERIQFLGASSDQVVFHDSAGNDFFEATPPWARMAGAGYENSAGGAGLIVAAASAGHDAARLVGSGDNDTLVVWGGMRTLYSGSLVQRTEGFERVEFDGGGSYDSIQFYTASRSPRLYGRSHYGWLTDKVFATHFAGIESLMASTRSGHKLRSDLAALDFVFQRIGRK